MTLLCPKIDKCLELIDTITLEKCIWAMEFTKFGNSLPKKENSSQAAKRALRRSKMQKSVIS